MEPLRVVHQLIRSFAEVTFDSSSDSDNDTDDETQDVILVEGVRGPTVKKPRVELFVENIVSRYDDADFKSHFRITRATCEHLLNMLGAKISVHEDPSLGGHPFLDPRKQLLFTLWFLGNPECYRSVCNLFDIGKATGLRAVRRVVDVLFELAPQIIKWPAREDQERLAETFAQQAHFPGVVGCIDGCHIPIQAPKEHPESYYNRKSFHSIVLQGVCDNNMSFTHCYVGEVGSVHDARILRKSEVNEYIHERQDEMFYNENYHIIGDAAYPVSCHLMAPYKDNGHLTRRQKNFNFRLSSTRMVIERAFGHLKGRWRRLKQLNMSRVDLIPKTVMACCVLHNICVMQNDPHFLLDLNDELNPRNLILIHRAQQERAGLEKRIQISNNLPMRHEAERNE